MVDNFKKLMDEQPNVDPAFKAAVPGTEDLELTEQGKDVVMMVSGLATIANIVREMKVEALKKFRADLAGVDDVQDALLEPFGADGRKKLRALTVRQVDDLLDLKLVVDKIHEVQTEVKEALRIRQETQNKVKGGQL